MQGPAILTLFLLLGVVFGSFGNVIILRSMEGRTIRGRSRCPKCSTVLRVLDLVPLFSFIFLRGRCRHCEARISWQYPIVEVASGVLFVLALWVDNFVPVSALPFALCLWLLLLITVVDLRTGLIADALSLPLIGLALGRAVMLHTLPWEGAAIALGFFGLQWVISRGRWIGSGDILLALGIALLLIDFRLFILSLFVAYIVGALVAVLYLVKGEKTLESQLPFGPFLAVGCVVALVSGDAILKFFL